MTRIHVPDIECDSCVRLISKHLTKEHITFSVNGDTIETDDAKRAIAIIKQLGYRASQHPFERKTFKERLRHMREQKHKYTTEYTGLSYFFGIAITLAVLFAVAYAGFLNTIPDFLAKYSWWMFYLIITIAAISTALWHFFAYRAKITCMVGMMIGMTFGMQTGMMLGAIVGATNGFFIGSMVGMLTAAGVGVITGRCCGIMGVMEGLMAGIMGGTMGAMISVMMFADNLLWFMPFFMGLNLIIVAGLSYMLYEEVVEDKEVERKPVDFLTVASGSIIAFAVIVAIILLTPAYPLL